MEQLLDLIAAIHDGVGSDEEWLAALDRLSDMLGGASIFLGSTQRDGSSFELSGHRVDPQLISMVNGELAGRESNCIYATISSLLRADPIGTVMRPIRLSDFLDAEVYHSSAIYTQAIARAGHEHAMAIVLSADAASALSLTIVRPKAAGDFSKQDCELVRAIGPHVVAALKLRHRLAIAQSAAMMLDRVDHGIMLLAASGHVVHRNADAERLLARRDGLQVDHGELRAAFPVETRALRHMILEADRAARGASLQPQNALRIRRPSGKPDLVLSALPAPPIVASSFGVGELATIALFVHDPDRDHASADRLVVEAFGLTPMEARVAVRIWHGDTIGETAAHLGISDNTVKTHLKSVFEKANVERQSTLVRKIAELVASVGHAEDQDYSNPHFRS